MLHIPSENTSLFQTYIKRKIGKNESNPKRFFPSIHTRFAEGDLFGKIKKKTEIKVGRLSLTMQRVKLCNFLKYVDANNSSNEGGSIPVRSRTLKRV